MLALLSKMRWDIEKSFDEIKNKLGENQAGASSATAKAMQAELTVLSVNLHCYLEHEPDKECIRDTPEDKRPLRRRTNTAKQAAKAGARLPKTLETSLCRPRCPLRASPAHDFWAPSIRYEGTNT